MNRSVENARFMNSVGEIRSSAATSRSSDPIRPPNVMVRRAVSLLVGAAGASDELVMRATVCALLPSCYDAHADVVILHAITVP